MLQMNGREDVSRAAADDQDQTRTLCIPIWEEFTVDEALASIGHGRVQLFLLVVLGLSCATYCSNIVLMSYLEPSVTCDWGLNNLQETMLSMIVFVGMMFGSSFWGALSSIYGRRIGTALSLAVEGSAGVLASVAPNYWVLFVLRGIVGIGLGGLASSFSMYSEFLPIGVRGYNLCWYQLFWAVGAVLETIAGWIVIPSHGWRALTLLTALPPIVLFPIVVLLPESPRYLLVTGQRERAMHILKKLAVINGTSVPDGRLKLPRPDDEAEEASPAGFAEQLTSLFVYPLNRVTPVVWFLSFALGVGYYGVVILASSVRTDDEKEEECIGHESSLDDSDFRSIFIDAAAEVPGMLLALFTVERLGRVRSLLVSWCACWIAMMLLMVFPDKDTMFLFIARLFTAYTDIFIFVMTPELYPSSCRCLAMGLMSSISQVGGMVAPLVARAMFNAYGLKTVAASCTALFIAADAVTFILLPFETAGRSLKDDINELCSDDDNEPLLINGRLDA